MAKISLRAYQDKLDSLLEANQFDEVIAHSRHILKTCPKNLRAYRQLGAALFAASRHEEAAEMLRRLLGALPQDFEAHSLLARACQQLEQYDKAIWHAERAFDQQPNNQDIISLIRRLYRERRGQEIERLPLTASALAQQHIRGSRLEEAVNALDAARQRHPNRIDLHLLRARALWLAGRRADAAETALEILTRLPYSRTANRIMTELWLSEQRPSDAEPYLGRLEELDPYLAYQLASGQAPDDSLVTIEQLDDGDITPSEDSVDLGWLNNLEDADDADDQEFDRGGIEASGLEALFGMDETAAPPPAATADLEDLLADSSLETLFTEPADDSPAETDESAAAPDDDEMPTDSPDQIAAADETEPDLTQLLEQLDSNEGDGSWLTDIQQGSLETDEVPPPPIHTAPPEPDDEAPSPEEEWISAAAGGLTGQRGEDFDLFADDEQLQTLLGKVNETQPIHPDDIEFWLNSNDIDFDEADAPADETDDSLDIDDLTDKSWLDDEFEDDFELEDEPTLDLIDDWQAELDDDSGDDDDDGYIDWLNEDEPPPQPELYDPLNAQADEAAEEELPSDKTARAWGLKDAEELSDFVDDEVELTEAEAAPDWLNAMAPGLDHDDSEEADDPAPAQASPSSAADFDWLNDIVDEETSEMPAVAPPTAPRFIFSKPPAWLTELLDAPSNQEIAAAAGLPLLEKLSAAASQTGDDLNFDALDLELGADDFDFDAPTEKIIPISAADDDISLDELDFDDYFDFDAPTEKMNAVSAEAIAFDELGLEDEDFDFDSPTEELTALDAEDATEELDFEAFESDGDLPPPAHDLPEWLEYDDAADDSDFDFSDPDKKAGR